jgi:rRNA maturation RNase YbeY
VDMAVSESMDLGETLEQTIDRLIIHGILHLLGYDHEKSEAEAERMENEEKRLLDLFMEV